MTLMSITKAAKTRKDTDSKGYTMFGNNPDNGKWFERWYPTPDKAVTFAEGKGWEYKEFPTANDAFTYMREQSA